MQDFGALEVMFRDFRWQKLLSADFFGDFRERQIVNGSHIGQSSLRADRQRVKRAFLAKFWVVGQFEFFPIVSRTKKIQTDPLLDSERR